MFDCEQLLVHKDMQNTANQLEPAFSPSSLSDRPPRKDESEYATSAYSQQDPEPGPSSREEESNVAEQLEISGEDVQLGLSGLDMLALLSVPANTFDKDRHYESEVNFMYMSKTSCHVHGHLCV